MKIICVFFCLHKLIDNFNCWPYIDIACTWRRGTSGEIVFKNTTCVAKHIVRHNKPRQTYQVKTQENNDLHHTLFNPMEDTTEVNSGEKAQHFVYKITEPRLKASQYKCWHRAFSNRCALYVFPVCAIVTSLVLVSLAFKTSRPGVSLGFSFLLFVLAIIYCVVANTVRFCLPDSELERRSDQFDSRSDKINMTVVVSL